MPRKIIRRFRGNRTIQEVDFWFVCQLSFLNYLQFLKFGSREFKYFDIENVYCILNTKKTEFVDNYILVDLKKKL